MSWLSIIIMVIRYGPDLFHLVSEIIALIKGADDPQAAEGHRVELMRAVETAKANGDRRPLRELRDRLYKHRDDRLRGPML